MLFFFQELSNDGKKEEREEKEERLVPSLSLSLPPPPRLSSSPFSSLLLQHHRLLQQVGHSLRRLRTHSQPLLDRRRVQVGLLAKRVVEAEALERPALSAVARVDRDEAVERGLLAAEALEADRDFRLDEEGRRSRGRGRGGGGAGGLLLLFLGFLLR